MPIFNELIDYPLFGTIYTIKLYLLVYNDSHSFGYLVIANLIDFSSNCLLEFISYIYIFSEPLSIGVTITHYFITCITRESIENFKYTSSSKKKYGPTLNPCLSF